MILTAAVQSGYLRVVSAEDFPKPARKDFSRISPTRQVDAEGFFEDFPNAPTSFDVLWLAANLQVSRVEASSRMSATPPIWDHATDAAHKGRQIDIPHSFGIPRLDSKILTSVPPWLWSFLCLDIRVYHRVRMVDFYNQCAVASLHFPTIISWLEGEVSLPYRGNSTAQPKWY